MQVKEIKSEGLAHELEITVPAIDIDKHVETRLREVGKTVRMPGFRPGKVPLAMLKKRYGKAIMGEVLEKAVNESTAKALDDKKLKPAMQPKIEVKEFDEGKDLTYKVELEVLPDFETIDLKGLKLEKPVANVDKKAIDEALSRITEQHKGSKKIESDRALKKGDIAVINFSGRTKDDGIEHPGMQANGTKLEIGSGQFIPGFEDQLIGKKAGQKVEVNVNFPADYGATELAGREAIFDVDVSEIHEQAKAEVNDDFAKDLGFENEKALREAVEQQISNDYEQHSRMKLKRGLLDVLDEKHDFDVPQQMLDAEYEGIIQQIERERQANPDETEELTGEEKEELKTISERRVRLGLILSDIGSKNNVSVSDQELQRAVISEAQKFPGQESQVFEFYKKNPQALESMRAPLYEDKVVDHVIGQVEVVDKEVSVEELLKQEEEGDFTPKPKKKKAASSKAKAKKTKSDDKGDKPKSKKKTAKKKD